VHTVNLRHETVVTPAAPFPRKEARPAEKEFRHMGLVLVLVGALLLNLAAEDALADAVLGGRGGDVLGGYEGSERLDGLGGEDAI
jgi:hypothetical protein